MTPGERTSSLTLRLRTCWFPFGSEDDPLSLAIEQNSMARFSKRTYEHWFPFHAHTIYSRLVSGSLNLPSRVLFSFHSRYYCTIGLGVYLGLEMNVSQIHARYPTHVTQGHRNSSSRFVHTGLSPSMVLRSSRSLVCLKDVTGPITPHFPIITNGDSVCPVPFSIAFTHGISIDFFSCGY